MKNVFFIFLLWMRIYLLHFFVCMVLAVDAFLPITHITIVVVTVNQKITFHVVTDRNDSNRPTVQFGKVTGPEWPINPLNPKLSCFMQ